MNAVRRHTLAVWTAHHRSASRSPHDHVSRDCTEDGLPNHCATAEASPDPLPEASASRVTHSPLSVSCPRKPKLLMRSISSQQTNGSHATGNRSGPPPPPVACKPVQATRPASNVHLTRSLSETDANPPWSSRARKNIRTDLCMSTPGLNHRSIKNISCDVTFVSHRRN